MNDGNDSIDVSLETDRLEQLLEVPEPTPPVVMIEYRNRGIPWWVVVPVMVVPAVIAVLVYRYSVVEKYRAKASRAEYLVKKLSTDNANAPLPGPDSPTAEPVVSAPAGDPAVSVAGVAGSASTSVPASSAKPAVPVPADSKGSVEQPRSGGTAVVAAGGEPEPAKGRVRSIMHSPFEDPGSAQEDDDDPAGLPKGSSGKAMIAGSPGAKHSPAKEQPRGVETSRVPGGAAAGPAGKLVTAEGAPGGVAGSPGSGERQRSAAMKQPLPSKEEWEQQLAQEAARKRIELQEEQLALLERMRIRQHDDRVKFREELGEILAGDIKKAGPLIDALVNRQRGDRDPRISKRASHIWQKLAPPAAKVNELRALGITESDILDLISDSLVPRMRTRGGPRDLNDLRVRAARQLLHVELSDADAAPAGRAGRSDALSPREPGGMRPQ